MADRRPLHVKCDACWHIWVVLYLPMEMLRAAAVMKGAACPMCGERKVFLATAAAGNTRGSSNG